MSRLWMGISPRTTEARVLVLEAGRPLLKARLPLVPRHWQAIPALCEAVALWRGEKVRAVLAVEREESWSDIRRSLDSVGGFRDSPLYELRLTTTARPTRQRLDGLGAFHDVRQLWLFGGEE